MKTSIVAALLLASVLAGCSSGNGKEGSGEAATAPVLYLNVTVGAETFRYTSAPSNGTSSASATVTVGGTATGTGSASATGTASAGGNATKGNATKGNATSPKGNQTVSGEAPLNVTVALGGTGLPESFTWTLDWGDGGNATGNLSATLSVSASASGTGAPAGNASAKANRTAAGQESGSKLPARLNHTYTAAGNHTIRFTLTPADGAATRVSAPVRVTAAANETGNATGNGTSVPPPEVTHFEFGETLGCTGDLPVGNTCQDYDAGPPGSGTDGHWIPLGPSYWGWMLTSTVDQGPAIADSDCTFVDEALAVVGNANNGGDACTGEVPDGAAWVFLYPYAAPALSLTVDFVPA